MSGEHGNVVACAIGVDGLWYGTKKWLPGVLRCAFPLSHGVHTRRSRCCGWRSWRTNCATPFTRTTSWRRYAHTHTPHTRTYVHTHTPTHACMHVIHAHMHTHACINAHNSRGRLSCCRAFCRRRAWVVYGGDFITALHPYSRYDAGDITKL